MVTKTPPKSDKTIWIIVGVCILIAIVVIIVYFTTRPKEENIEPPAVAIITSQKPTAPPPTITPVPAVRVPLATSTPVPGMNLTETPSPAPLGTQPVFGTPGPVTTPMYTPGPVTTPGPIQSPGSCRIPPDGITVTGIYSVVLANSRHHLTSNDGWNDWTSRISSGARYIKFDRGSIYLLSELSSVDSTGRRMFARNPRHGTENRTVTFYCDDPTTSATPTVCPNPDYIKYSGSSNHYFVMTDPGGLTGDYIASDDWWDLWDLWANTSIEATIELENDTKIFLGEFQTEIGPDDGFEYKKIPDGKDLSGSLNSHVYFWCYNQDGPRELPPPPAGPPPPPPPSPLLPSSAPPPGFSRFTTLYNLNLEIVSITYVITEIQANYINMYLGMPRAEAYNFYTAGVCVVRDRQLALADGITHMLVNDVYLANINNPGNFDMTGQMKDASGNDVTSIPSGITNGQSYPVTSLKFGTFT